MIRIITDSAADITPSQALDMGIELASLSIQFEDRLYRQEEDTDFLNFYTLLADAKELPTTSQPSPEVYAKMYRKAQEAGDEVLVVTLSSKLSGTYQSATIAKELVPEAQVHIVDSLNAVMAQRLLVEHAVHMREAGKSAPDIAQSLTKLRDRVTLLAMIDTLDYLAKGGRMPKTMAALGKLLRIKPIVTIKDGVLSMIGKARGPQAMTGYMADASAIDPNFPVYFGFTAYEEPGRKFMLSICEKLNLVDTGLFPVGGLIGAHAGPGCIAVAYIAKEA